MFDNLNLLSFFVVILIGLLAMGFLILFFRFFGLWLRAMLSGAYVGMGRIIGMWLRHVTPGIIVDSRIMLTKAGIDINSDMLETFPQQRRYQIQRLIFP